MKTLLRGMAVGALLLTSACFYPGYRVRAVYREPGYGGSGVDLSMAEDACRRRAYAEGWRWVREERMSVTGPYTARIRFLADGIPFRSHVTCFYDARTNFADVR